MYSVHYWLGKAKLVLKPLRMSLGGSTRLSRETDCSIWKFSMFTHKFRLYIVTLEIQGVKLIESESPNPTEIGEIQSCSSCLIVKAKDVDPNISTWAVLA